MDPQRFTTLAHATHDFCNPVAEETLNRFVAAFGLSAGARVLDVGCGKGELLIRVVERWKAHGVGVDINPAFLADARRRAAGRAAEGAIEWIQSPVAEARLEPASFDLAILLGATHAFGTLATALGALRALVRPHGQVLLGHGYWKQPPDPDYLAGFGASRDELGSHDDILVAAGRAGFDTPECTLSSPAEWDAYEDPYAANIERFCAEHPDDPDRDAMLERIRNWRRLYLRWGRDTMGFGLYRMRTSAR